jgi:hypothetical protein
MKVQLIIIIVFGGNVNPLMVDAKHIDKFEILVWNWGGGEGVGWSDNSLSIQLKPKVTMRSEDLSEVRLKPKVSTRHMRDYIVVNPKRC